MADHPPLKFAAIGLDHRHIYHQVGRLLELGAECRGYYARDSAVPLDGFVRRFPDLPRVRDVRALLEEPAIQLIVTAAIPSERGEIALEAMRHGKDVMVDKPGVITQAQLADVMHLQRETGRIWSVDFSERFEVRAMTRATELVQAGAIGRGGAPAPRHGGLYRMKKMGDPRGRRGPHPPVLGRRGGDPPHRLQRCASA